MVRKLPNKSNLNLSRIEKRGNPESVAAEHISMGFTQVAKTIGYPRASSLYDSCMRMHVLGVRHGIVTYERLSLSDRLTFGIGNSVHGWIQNSTDVFGNNRYGWWKCTACGTIRGFGRPPEWSCRRCGAHQDASIYHEHSLVAPEPFKCSGHPDLFIKPQKRLRLVEVKTIASDGFKKLAAPYVQHNWQLQFYMWASSHDEKLAKRVNRDIGYILYVSKGVVYRSLPFKMFVVKRDKYIIRQIKEKLSLFTEHLENNTLPEKDLHCREGNNGGYGSGECPCYEVCKKGEG